MGSEFFELPAEEQQKSLTAFAHELLTNYGINNAEVSCINFEFNATFSVETETGVKYALRINIICCDVFMVGRRGNRRRTNFGSVT